MRIGFVSADWGRAAPGVPPHAGGAGWVRIHQPAAMLAQHGHQVVVGAGVAGGRDDRLVPLDHHAKPLMLDPQIMVFQRWMNDEAATAIRDARKAGQIILQDVDDWFWGLDPRNQAHHSTSKRTNDLHNREHYKAAVEASDAAIVSTEFLARRLRERMGVQAIVVRNAVDQAAFATQPVRDVTDGLVVGWTGALAWRSGDLETMRDVLPGFLADCGGTFVHHGVFPADTETAADRIGLPPNLVGPSKRGKIPTDYPENVAGFDIGIVPLNDIPFNHAKSWIKGLEYAAAGIPFVAQATTEYEALGCGLTAATPAQWRDALDRLRDPQVRAAEAAKGLKVAADHDLRVRWRDWEKVYQSFLR